MPGTFAERQRAKHARKFKRKNQLGNAMRILKSLVETKRLSNKAITRPFGNDQAAYCLTDMAEGDTSITRTGLKVSGRSLEIRSLIVWPASSTQPCRVIIVQDKCQAGVIPAVYGTSGVLEQNDVGSLYENLTVPNRFRILSDKTYTYPNNLDAASSYSKSYQLKLNLKLKPIHYVGSGAADADMGKNNIYMILMTNTNLANATAPDFIFNSRFLYDDA